MQASDRKEFAEALTQLFAVYGAELTGRVLTAWWGVLEPYRLPAVLAAMNLHAGDVERGMFRPTPADVRKHLELTIPRMLAERRTVIANEARARIAPLRERVEMARNDVRLGLMDVELCGTIVMESQRAINTILSEQNVALALASDADLRDREREIAPRDRLPAVVRRALGWLGSRHG